MTTFRATRPGMLPRELDIVLAGERLPRGRLVVPDPSFAVSAATTEPVLWTTERAVSDYAGLWRVISAEFNEHGLWPVALESLASDDERPWFSGELDPSSSSNPDGHSAHEVLEAQWAGVVPEDEEDESSFTALAPFGRAFPGLAGGSPPTEEPASLIEVVDGLAGRLGLVAVTRPADVPFAIGWSGPVNHYADMGLLSAVLRSWEDRFGAFVVGIGFDTLTLAVERPPTSIDLATALAAEHFAICSDNVYQGVGSIEEYANELVAAPTWQFWWD